MSQLAWSCRRAFRSTLVVLAAAAALGCGKSVADDAASAGAGGDDSPGGGNSGTGNGGGGGTLAGSSGKGGAGAVAGQGGGGTGGVVLCAPGAACSEEGAMCLGGGCCPCSYRCDSARWVTSGCPSCAAPECPPLAPPDGEPCDACAVPESCDWDACEDTGMRTHGKCSDGIWSVTSAPCETALCCTSDDECTAGVCANTQCKLPVAGCWRDADCGDGEKCSGVLICPCTADCDAYDEPGQCVPADDACCTADGDCKGDAICVHGVCKEPAAPDACWRNSDCALGGPCDYELVCPCGSVCAEPDRQGMCFTP